MNISSTREDFSNKIKSENSRVNEDEIDIDVDDFDEDDAEQLKRVSLEDELTKQSKAGQEEREESKSPWVNYFEKNYIAPYDDGFDSYFRRGKIVEIMDSINTIEENDSIKFESDLEMQNDLEKVKNLGYDVLAPLVKYWKQSKVLNDAMQEVRKYLTRELGKKRNGNMDANMDISYDGTYRAMLESFESKEYEEIILTDQFSDLASNLRREMDLLRWLREGIIAKSDEYIQFESAAMKFIEKYALPQSNKLDGGPESPNDHPTISLLNNTLINGDAAKELRSSNGI